MNVIPHVGPNDACPCGSGRKYKRCCGADLFGSSEAIPSENATSITSDGTLSTQGSSFPDESPITISAAEIKTLLAQGEYYRALGVSSCADRITIDGACTMFCEEYPELAGKASMIAEVLTDPRRKAIYQHAYSLRNRVANSLAERYGADLFTDAPGLRSSIWHFCQQLFQSEFEVGRVLIGPRAAESLIDPGVEWVAEDAINHALAPFSPDAAARKRGRVDITWPVQCDKCGNARRLRCAECEGNGKVLTQTEDSVPILVDNPEPVARILAYVPCPKCRSQGWVYCDCFDKGVLHIPPGARRGSVLISVGELKGLRHHCLLDGPSYSPRPYGALQFLYRSSKVRINAGQSSLWSDCDYTFEEAKWYTRHLTIGFLLALPLIFWGIGWLLTIPLIGVGTGVVYLVFGLLDKLMEAHEVARRAVILKVGLAIIPLSALALSWREGGAVPSIVLALVWLALYVACWLLIRSMNRRMG